jgi:hypothetical protein
LDQNQAKEKIHALAPCFTLKPGKTALFCVVEFAKEEALQLGVKA